MTEPTHNATDDAVDVGMAMARKVFAKRGNHSEIHLSEGELAGLLGAAYSAASEKASMIPLEPTPAMIEAGAQRLVRWETGKEKWPESWNWIEVRAARQEAERVWRSMWLEAKDSPCTSGAQALSGRGADEAEMAPIGLEGDRVAATGTRTTALSAGAESIAAKYFGSLASEATAADWAAVVGQLERELAEERFEHEETKRDLYDERKASLKSAASATAPSAEVEHEFMSEVVSDALDPSVGVNWMRCSPDLPKYVQRLERELAEALSRAEYEQSRADGAVAELEAAARSPEGDTTSDVHSCSYYCKRPDCVKAQRDELRDRLERSATLPTMDNNADWQAAHDASMKLDKAISERSRKNFHAALRELLASDSGKADK